MLASILGVLILAAVFILFLANASAGAYASLIAILFAPYIQVSSGLSFRIEHLLLPLILLALCIRSYRTGRPLACPRLAALYALWWLISLVSTLCSAAGSEVTVEWLGAYGYLRPVLIILIFANVFPDAQRSKSKAHCFERNLVPHDRAARRRKCLVRYLAQKSDAESLAYG